MKSRENTIDKRDIVEIKMSLIINNSSSNLLLIFVFSYP